MGSHRVHAYIYLAYALHWPGEGCFTAETYNPDVIDISSMRWYKHVFLTVKYIELWDYNIYLHAGRIESVRKFYRVIGKL